MAYEALGATLAIRQRDEDTASLQHELQRLGFLVEGTGRFGADGIWGERTAGALRAAARYVRWGEPPYSPPDADRMRRGTVTVPDDLIARLREARPAPSGTPGALTPSVTDAVEPSRSTFIGPKLDPAGPPDASDTNWVPVLVGGGVLLFGGILAVTMMQKKKRRAVAANRRRRRRHR